MYTGNGVAGTALDLSGAREAIEFVSIVDTSGFLADVATDGTHVSKFGRSD